MFFVFRLLERLEDIVDKSHRAKDSTKGDWSSGMIPALGAGGPGFNSRIAPFFKQFAYTCKMFKIVTKVKQS